MAEPEDQQQCHAITNAGTQCTRLAKDGKFCFQHDETDEQIDGEGITPAAYINILSDQFESASVQLSGAPKDLTRNFKDIVDEAGSIGSAVTSGDLSGAIQGFRRTVGKTAPSTGTAVIIGAVATSPFGPVGVAAGATAGGIYGVYRSLNDDRAVGASIAEDIPEDANVVSSHHHAIADVDPIQLAIRSAVETEEADGKEWLRSSATRERDMDAVANALDAIPAYEPEGELTQYFIRDEELGEILLLIFGIPEGEE